MIKKASRFTDASSFVHRSLDEVWLEDPDSRQLRHSRTLGRPLGCLKVAPYGEKRLSHSTMMWLAFVMGLATSLVSAAIIAAFPQVDLGEATAWSITLAAVVITLAAAAYLIRVKHSTRVEVHELGLRFSRSGGLRERTTRVPVDRLRRTEQAGQPRSHPFVVWDWRVVQNHVHLSTKRLQS